MNSHSNWLAMVLTLVTFTFAAMTPGHDGTITEDDPRWNCRTMGNQICGFDTIRWEQAP